ncbi:hypothetical protein C8R45DRAFT_1049885 [Mycena sanguinolenta]|nr:hypothetical protein C8R45DRAFT_1049885 [Mycena sanguinolenta]
MPLAARAWIKTLADLHNTTFKPYSAQQFTTCFDLYLKILNNVDSQVKTALGRDAEDWCLKNCCPACTYKLEGEAKMVFDMLCTCDGNNSLKQILRKRKEEAKYPLAIENAILDAFGLNIGLQYNIGCGHEKTIKKSPLAAKAKALNLKILIGAFHGHAHNRRCQLRYLATYVDGLGLKDLEGCEHLFSKSNWLARSI